MAADLKVLQWTPEYPAWLNLMWQPAGLEYHMTAIQRTSELLAMDSGYWSAVIRDDNWRLPLVGSACALVRKNRGFFADLCHRFTNGSMVTPQLAVAIGLLHPDEAIRFLETELNKPAANRSPQRVVSAQTALARLGRLKESEIVLRGWPLEDQDYAEMAHAVVGRHWDFWYKRGMDAGSVS
jgi:hypothetical protein